jgi:hypothetical protein
MTTYSCSKAQQNLDMILKKADKDGGVRIKTTDGKFFIIKPEAGLPSPLDVKGINLGLTTSEIIDFIHEGRKK